VEWEGRGRKEEKGDRKSGVERVGESGGKRGPEE